MTDSNSRCGVDVPRQPMKFGPELTSYFERMAAESRAIKLDFIIEVGELITSFGLAITAAASAERLDILEMALRQARAALLDGIAEFKALTPNDGEVE
jgi:hypothetical protein